MDNIKKTSLQEAKANYEEIKKFATEAAKREFENEINERVEKILKESLSVEVDDENNVTIVNGEKVIELTNDGEIEVEDNLKHDSEMDSEHGEEYHDDDEEIEIEKNIDEMIKLEQDQQVAPEAPEAPEMSAIEPMDTESPETEEAPVDDAVMKLAQDIKNIIDQAIDQKVGGQAGEQGVDYIDDEENAEEAPVAPEATPEAAPAPAPAAQAPIQEDDLLEFSLEEISDFGMGNEDDDMMEFDLPETDDMDMMSFDLPDDIEGLEVIGNDDEYNQDYELEEMKGQSKLIRNTSNRLGLEPREGTPNLNEAKKIKVQYESKIGELKQENNRLNESVKELSEVIKNYQSSFVDLRKQFDEMQTFNAKLAYANKIFASGGLSTADKTRIAEDFDRTQNVDEAKKLYNKILEENKISITKDTTSKLKASITNTIKAKEVVYESADMKRRKVLAGIEKNEDYI